MAGLYLRRINPKCILNLSFLSGGQLCRIPVLAYRIIVDLLLTGIPAVIRIIHPENRIRITRRTSASFTAGREVFQ